MAMRVPIYENQETQNQGTPLSVPNLATPPESAFGTGLAQQTENSGKVLAGLGDKLGEHMIERARQEQQFQTLGFQNQYLQGVQNTMFGQGATTTPDGRTIPAGVMNRQLGDAKGATIDFDAQNKALQDNILSQVNNPYQYRQLKERMDEHTLYHRQLVIHHEATQDRQNKEEIVNATMVNMANSAGMFEDDPEGLNSHIKMGQQVIHNGMMDLGKNDPNILSRAMDEFATNATVAAIKESIVDNPYHAKAMFDAVKDNMLPASQLKMEKAIRSGIKQFEAGKKVSDVVQFNEPEAQAGSMLANGQMNQLYLDQHKELSPEFKNLATNALETGIGKSPKDSTALSLIKKYADISSLDGDKKTIAMVKLRREIIANAPFLAPGQFSQLLGYTDPNFVKQVQPQKLTAWQAGLNWISDAAHKAGLGDAMDAIHEFTQSALNPGTKKEDIPAIAQGAIKGDILKANPSLVGQPDLANNVVNAGGIKQATTATTTLKPQQTISAPKQFKPGDKAIKEGKTYIRGEDGKWRPQ